MSRLVNVIAKIIGLCLIGCCLCFDWQMSNWRIAIGKGLISGRQIGKWHSIKLDRKSSSCHEAAAHVRLVLSAA